MKTITFNNKVKIPQVGLGVFRTENGEDTVNAVKWAIDAGYRHIDTAKAYGNEKSVGDAIRTCGIKREELFITTKLWNEDTRNGRALQAFDESLEKLQTDYIDLYLIHLPADGFEKAWKDMEQIYKSGRVKAIGVSNFNIHHLEALSKVWEIVPAVNQIEVHPYYSNVANVEYGQKLGITIEAYSPLGGNGAGTLSDPVINEIAKKHKKTPAQVVLRWNMQRNIVVLPKSTHKERIESNYDVFDFELDNDDMNMINSLNKDDKFGSDPDNFKF